MKELKVKKFAQRGLHIIVSNKDFNPDEDVMVLKKSEFDLLYNKDKEKKDLLYNNKQSCHIADGSSKPAPKRAVNSKSAKVNTAKDPPAHLEPDPNPVSDVCASWIKNGMSCKELRRFVMCAGHKDKCETDIKVQHEDSVNNQFVFHKINMIPKNNNINQPSDVGY